MRHRAAGKSRIEAIDIARGAALVAMAVYHFGWDLEFFGYLDAGTTITGGWRLLVGKAATRAAKECFATLRSRCTMPSPWRRTSARATFLPPA